ncbi:glycosyltransferase involved in cell wall biosynthesis [Propionicimonas paludicola]|uniref:Glycosyltransferase involved in cell wall biosynthesis n=1 Tax=Propionicimonas paludicola TaxID=185243 RepID=A0A2A9CQ45_9ACTN|nr:glycosyltransferase [Propionicimonas paludicola]PFG16205.1 glycosyltransferase involved in cell wall biosynthesis [Propionicimonas paludicola]
MTTYGFLSTYPPTRCGLATFTAALVNAISANGSDTCVVVRVDDLVPAGPSLPGPRIRLAGTLHPDNPQSTAQAAAQLNRCDVAIVQHEYGIYGGPDGDQVLDLLARLRTPSIIVLHTVLAEPTQHQREVLMLACNFVDTVVVMTHRAQALLVSDYAIPAERIQLIPHGVDPWLAGPEAVDCDRPTVLTWGLLGPGKGIEWGIRALAELRDLSPHVRYRVLGQTHPKVLREQGDRYRSGLLDLAAMLGVSDDVEIDGRYQASEELADAVASADLVLLPYDSIDQSTSGVLTEAVAAGKVVIATRFPHAVELLSDGRGLLVEHQNPSEIAATIREVLSNPSYAAAAQTRASTEAERNSWANVADRYRALVAGPARTSISA